MLSLTSLNHGHIHSIPHLQIYKDPVGMPITNPGEWTPELKKRQCDKGENPLEMEEENQVMRQDMIAQASKNWILSHTNNPLVTRRPSQLRREKVEGPKQTNPNVGYVSVRLLEAPHPLDNCSSMNVFFFYYIQPQTVPDDNQPKDFFPQSQ